MTYFCSYHAKKTTIDDCYLCSVSNAPFGSCHKIKDKKVVEKLADEVHDIWRNWMNYVFDVCVISDTHEGIVIPMKNVERWQRQMNTDYKDLPEEEKRSDIIIALKFMELLNARNKK